MNPTRLAASSSPARTRFGLAALLLGGAALWAACSAAESPKSTNGDGDGDQCPGATLFSVCESKVDNADCWDDNVSVASCSLGAAQLQGTGFEASAGGWDDCTIGGGTYWLTTSGNIIPGDIIELRIVIWDVGDSVFDSLALIDGFKWLPDATVPGTG